MEALETNVDDLNPELVVVQTDIAPRTRRRWCASCPAFRPGMAWPWWCCLCARRNSTAGTKASITVRGIYIAPVNWTEIAQAGYGAAMTARANMSQTAPMQQSVAGPVVGGSAAFITGDRAHRSALACRWDGLLDHRGEPGVRAGGAIERQDLAGLDGPAALRLHRTSNALPAQPDRVLRPPRQSLLSGRDSNAAKPGGAGRAGVSIEYSEILEKLQPWNGEEAASTGC